MLLDFFEIILWSAMATMLLAAASELKRGPRRAALRAAVFEHLSLVAGRALPLGPGLEALARERERLRAGSWWLGRRFAERRARAEGDLLRALAARLQATGSLHAALASVAALGVPPTELELIRVAEEHGALPELLATLVQEHGARERAGHRVTELAVYPLLVTAVVGVVVTFQMVVVYPKWSEIAGSMDIDIDFTFAGGLTALTMSLFACGGLAWSIVRRGGRPGRLVERALLEVAARAPLVGPPTRRLLHARWLQRTAALLRAGATLPEALASAARVDGGPRRSALGEAAGLAGQGHPLPLVLGAALGPERDALLASLLLAVGAADAVATGLQQAGERIGRAAWDRVVVAVSLLRPAPILLCATVVAAHSMAIWTALTAFQSSIVENVR